jgi:hypothetical protein
MSSGTVHGVDVALEVLPPAPGPVALGVEGHGEPGGGAVVRVVEDLGRRGVLASRERSADGVVIGQEEHAADVEEQAVGADIDAR